MTPVARRAIRGGAGLVVIIIAVQLGLIAVNIDQSVFPLPSTVLVRAAGLLKNGSFLASTGQTLLAWAEAMVVTVVIAIPAGLVLGSVPRLESALRPLIEFLRPIPSVVLLPLILLIVQDNARTEVVVIAFASIWPVLINTMYGLREVDPVAKQTLRSFGFGPVAVALRVSLPSSAPFIATGVRITASLSFVVAIAAELIGTGMNGLGAFAANSQSGGGDVALMIAIAVWCGLIGLAINAVFITAERRLFGWHRQLALASGGQS
jgi:NitT/TauT family transport system permease protein